MVPLSSSIISQFLIAGLVVGAVPYTVAKSITPDEDAHRPVAMAAPSTEDLAAEHRYLQLAEATTVEPPPEATVEEVAIALAASLAAIPVGNLEGAASCPAEKLTVSWEEPSAEHTHGAFVTPLGPAPGPDTDEVNGVVLCDGYPYAFMGFEAARDGSTWDVVAVPFLGADEDEHGHEPPNDDADHHAHDDHHHGPVVPAPRIDIPVADLGPIEGYAAYEPQRICHPTAKPGTDALRRLLTGHYTATRNLGIARGCTVGGRSEHKEGRAFDWGAYVHRDVERKSVEDLIGRLLATDEAGNRHALARRMGVMYVIWNERIWSAYRPEAGWRPYGGRSPHTDHAHISLSWDGAMGRTSFWNANGVDALFGTPAGTTVAAAKPVHAAPAAGDGHARRDDHDDDHADHREVSDEGARGVHADRDEARKEYEQRIREWRQAWERRQREREERRAAGEPIDEESEAEVAAREAEEATEEAREALEEAEDETGRAERREQHGEERAAERQTWEAARAERRQREQERRDAWAAALDERRQREQERRDAWRAAVEQHRQEQRQEHEARQTAEQNAREERERVAQEAAQKEQDARAQRERASQEAAEKKPEAGADREAPAPEEARHLRDESRGDAQQGGRGHDDEARRRGHGRRGRGNG